MIDGPISMLLWCPQCNRRHIDKGTFGIKTHHTHACQFCGMVWRPAVVPTVGVQFLPGCKDLFQEINVGATVTGSQNDD